MKYICHMTSASDDEKIVRLIELAGLEGYAAYWIIVEKIAAQIRPECVSISLQMSYKSWSNILKTHPLTARRLLGILQQSGLCSVTVDGEFVKVEVPNILKYADEYTKRILKISGEHPDKLPIASRLPEQPEQPEQPDISNNHFGPSKMTSLWNDAILYFSKNGQVKIPRVTKLTPSRSQKCSLRIKDCELSEPKWKNILNIIHKDDWMSGAKPSAKYPNWTATFDWVVHNQENIIRILERQETVQ